MDTERFGKEIGKRLRFERVCRGLTLRDVAEKSGRWSAAAVGSWERGDRDAPVERLAGLAEFYNINLKAIVAASWEAAMPAARTPADHRGG